MSANLDGTGLSNVLTTGLNDPRGIALDLGARKAYVADLGSDRILRFNMDGTSLDVMAAGLDSPIDVSIPEPLALPLLALAPLALSSFGRGGARARRTRRDEMVVHGGDRRVGIFQRR